MLACLKSLETQNAELESVRTENRLQSRFLEDRQAEITYLRERLGQVLHDAQVMSLVR